jgi:hypothetical protein
MRYGCGELKSRAVVHAYLVLPVGITTAAIRKEGCR